MAATWNEELVEELGAGRQDLVVRRQQLDVEPHRRGLGTVIAAGQSDLHAGHLPNVTIRHQFGRLVEVSPGSLP